MSVCVYVGRMGRLTWRRGPLGGAGGRPFVAAVVPPPFLRRQTEKCLSPWHPISSCSEEEAIKLIQVNERGRQGRERQRIMQSIKRQQQLAERALQSGKLLKDAAAVKIQSLVRGHLTRMKVKSMSEV